MRRVDYSPKAIDTLFGLSRKLELPPIASRRRVDASVTRSQSMPSNRLQPPLPNTAPVPNISHRVRVTPSGKAWAKHRKIPGLVRLGKGVGSEGLAHERAAAVFLEEGERDTMADHRMAALAREKVGADEKYAVLDAMDFLTHELDHVSVQLSCAKWMEPKLSST